MKKERIQEVICVLCPEGCKITVTLENTDVVKIENAGCKRGEDYSIEEIKSPKRDFFSTVRVCGRPETPLTSVRSTKPVPKEMLLPCASELAKLVVPAPVKMGDVIVRNILNLGVDIIATREVEEA